LSSAPVVTPSCPLPRVPLHPRPIHPPHHRQQLHSHVRSVSTGVESMSSLPRFLAASAERWPAKRHLRSPTRRPDQMDRDIRQVHNALELCSMAQAHVLRPTTLLHPTAASQAQSRAKRCQITINLVQLPLTRSHESFTGPCARSCIRWVEECYVDVLISLRLIHIRSAISEHTT
jgi:hypothetical protein